MTETFVAAEQKEAILLDWSACTGAELISSECRGGALVEEVARIKRTVPHKFQPGTMKLICPSFRNCRYLRAGPLSVLGGIRVRKHIKFAPGIDAEQVPAH